MSVGENDIAFSIHNSSQQHRGTYYLHGSNDSERGRKSRFPRLQPLQDAFLALLLFYEDGLSPISNLRIEIKPGSIAKKSREDTPASQSCNTPRRQASKSKHPRCAICYVSDIQAESSRLRLDGRIPRPVCLGACDECRR